MSWPWSWKHVAEHGKSSSSLRPQGTIRYWGNSTEERDQESNVLAEFKEILHNLSLGKEILDMAP